MPQQAPAPGNPVTLWLTVIICDSTHTLAGLPTARFTQAFRWTSKCISSKALDGGWMCEAKVQIKTFALSADQGSDTRACYTYTSRIINTLKFRMCHLFFLLAFNLLIFKNIMPIWNTWMCSDILTGCCSNLPCAYPLMVWSMSSTLSLQTSWYLFIYVL